VAVIMGRQLLIFHIWIVCTVLNPGTVNTLLEGEFFFYHFKKYDPHEKTFVLECIIMLS
jgi:hypothetical protein